MNYVEKYLYNYKANVYKIKILHEKSAGLMSLHGQSLQVSNSKEKNDPVGNIVNQKINLDRKIARIENKYVKPVEKLINDLSKGNDKNKKLGEILQLRYIQHENKDEIIKKIGISKRTFWRRVRELIAVAKQYFLNYRT